MTIIERNVQDLLDGKFSPEPESHIVVTLKPGEYSAIQVALSHYLSSHAGVKNG